MTRYQNKKISIDNYVNLPKKIFSKSFPEGDVHIAKENPSWILTSTLETEILEQLMNKQTIRESAIKVYETGKHNLEEVEDSTKSLLEKLEAFGFYEGHTVQNNENLALHLYLTTGCNLSCKHCYKDAGKKREKELTTKEIKSLIDDFSTQGKTQVVLSGGEPLTRTDFFEIAGYIKSKGHQVNLVTNGTLIKDIETAKKITGVVDFLQISLDGCTPEKNDYYRGKGTYEKIINAINQFEGLDFEVNIGMVVSEVNYEDIKNNLSTLLNDKIKHKKIKINVSGLMDYGRGQYCKKEGKSHDYVEKLFQEATKLGIKQKQWRLPNTKAFDCGYARSITVDANGDIYHCPVANEHLKAGLNIRTTPMSEIMCYFKAKNSEVSVELMEGCTDCELEYLCGGGCRLENKLQRGSLLNPKCSPERKERVYKELIKLRLDA